MIRQGVVRTLGLAVMFMLHLATASLPISLWADQSCDAEYDDNGSAARRITEEAFEGSLGETDNGDTADDPVTGAWAAEDAPSHPVPVSGSHPQKGFAASDDSDAPAAK